MDVEVDRCIDENSASNLKHRLSLNKASSTKTEDPSINQISDSSQIASRNPNFFLTVTRLAPTTDIYEGIYNRMKDISICILIRFNMNWTRSSNGRHGRPMAALAVQWPMSSRRPIVVSAWPGWRLIAAARPSDRPIAPANFRPMRPIRLIRPITPLKMH